MQTHELIDELLEDQSERWHKGIPVPVEEYLAEFLSLQSAEPNELLPLIFNEYRLRFDSGRAPHEVVFLRRFNRFLPELETMLRIHREIAADFQSAAEE